MSIYSDYANAATQILQQMGQAQAQGALGRGQAWGQTLGNIGTLIAEAPERARARQLAALQLQGAQQQVELGGLDLQQRKQQAAAQRALGGLFGQDDIIGEDGLINLATLDKKAASDPALAAQWPAMRKTFAAMNEDTLKMTETRLKNQAAERDALANLANSLDGQSVHNQAAILATSLASHVKTGGLPQADYARYMRMIANPDGTVNPEGVQTLVTGFQKGSAAIAEKTAQAKHAMAQTQNIVAGLPGTAAEAERKQRELSGLSASGQTPLQAAQTQEAIARVPLIAAQTQAEQQRPAQIAAQTQEAMANLPKLKAEAAKASAEAAQMKAAQGMAGAAAATPPAVAGERNEAFLNTLSPSIATQVKALAEGRMQFPSSFALKTPYWQSMLSAVATYDPSFDQVNYNARASTRKDFTSGKAGQQVNAINTVIGHLDDLSTAADNLHNTGSPLLNVPLNAISSKLLGRPGVKNFNTVKKAVADEVTRVWRQAGGSEGDIKAASENLDAAGSPEQLHQAIATYGHLLESKLQALQNQYQQGMGTAGVQMVTPKSRQTLDTLERKAGGGAATAGVKILSITPIEE